VGFHLLRAESTSIGVGAIVRVGPTGGNVGGGGSRENSVGVGRGNDSSVGRGGGGSICTSFVAAGTIGARCYEPMELKVVLQSC
jgi:hypothetical protein